MHVEATRLLTAWLGHPQYGVNALLPSIPRDLFGGQLEDEEPEPVTIYNDVDFDSAMDETVLGVNPPVRPALVVVFDVSPKGIDIEQIEKPAHLYNMVGVVAYYSEDGINRMQARRQGGYTLRAVGRSLVRYNLGRISKSRTGTNYRMLNDIEITKITNMTFVRPAGAVPQSQMQGAVFLDLIVKDRAP